ncbi:MAG: SH3 domain-containing protein [Anaerolineales bacterium]
MNAEQIFELYLENRIQKANAVTPGQKLDVVRQLRDEARLEGKIPSGENSVVKVPLDSQVVQAVLRGEPVSIGETVVKRKTGLQSWSTGQKLALLGGGAGVFMMLFIVFLLVSSGSAAPKATPALELTATPAPELTGTPMPTETPAPIPTDTAIPVLLGAGSPAEDANAPASLEILGRLFVLQQGKVDDKTGKWNPQGPEWLAGTEVRRVIALPQDRVSDLPIQPGDDITLRTRNGRVVVYPVTRVVSLSLDQIETFMSLSPSIIVTLFDPSQADSPNNTQRLAVIGELNPPPAASATPILLHTRAQVIKGVNLRLNPSMKAAIIVGLPKGTWLDVSNPLQTVSVEGFVWVFVHSPFGNGWVVRDFLSIP